MSAERRRLIAVLLVVIIALALRLRAVEWLPIDSDGENYLGAALPRNDAPPRGAIQRRAVFILPWAIPEFVGALVWLSIIGRPCSPT
jgi:hypothetical protein